MNGFAALDIHPHRRYVIDIGGRRSSRCRLHINFALFLHSLDFTQNLGLTRRCRLHINFALFLHSLDFTQNLGLTPQACTSHLERLLCWPERFFQLSRFRLPELVQNLFRYSFQQCQSVLIIAPELHVSQFLEDTGLGGGFQRLFQLGSLLFQPLVFGGSFSERYIVLLELGVHLFHSRDITVQQFGNLGSPFLAVQGSNTGKQFIQFLTLLVESSHLLEDAGWNVVAARLTGALAALQVGVLLDHVFPEFVLPPSQLLFVANNVFSTQAAVWCQWC